MIERRAAMQDGFKQRWRRMVSEEPENVDLGDFGFYDPDGIGDWADAYILSKFNPGHLPRPGGIRNQTAADKHDLEVYLRGYAWAQFEKDDAKRTARQLEDEGFKDYTL